METKEEIKKQIEEREEYCPEETYEQGGKCNYTDILKARLESYEQGREDGLLSDEVQELVRDSYKNGKEQAEKDILKMIDEMEIKQTDGYVVLKKLKDKLTGKKTNA